MLQFWTGLAVKMTANGRDHKHREEGSGKREEGALGTEGGTVYYRLANTNPGPESPLFPLPASRFPSYRMRRRARRRCRPSRRM